MTAETERKVLGVLRAFVERIRRGDPVNAWALRALLAEADQALEAAARDGRVSTDAHDGAVRSAP